MTPEEFDRLADRLLQPDPEPDAVYVVADAVVFYVYRRNEEKEATKCAKRN